MDQVGRQKQISRDQLDHQLALRQARGLEVECHWGKYLNLESKDLGSKYWDCHF